MAKSKGGGDAVAKGEAVGHARRQPARKYSPYASRPFMRKVHIALIIIGFVCAITGIALFVSAVRDYVTEYQERGENITQVSGDAIDEHHDVLLLMSYDETHITVPYEREGVLDVLEPLNTTTEIEYLRTKTYPLGSKASDATIQALGEKLKYHDPYDVVIAADDDALAVVRDHHDDFFAGAPVVFFGINNLAFAQEVADLGWSTGVLETNYFTQMMELACKLCPQANNVVVITDQTSTGIGDIEQFRALEDDFPGYSFRELDTGIMSYDEVCHELEQLDDSSFVFHVSSYTDVNGDQLTIPEAAQLFSQHCPVPIFRGNIGGVGDGFCAAAYCDFSEAGAKAANMAVSIMDGADPASIPLDKDYTHGFIFDAVAMEKFGIDRNSLPEGTIVLNSADDVTDIFLDPATVPALFILVSLSAFLIYAFAGYRLSAQDAQKLIESRNQLNFELYHDHLTGLPNRRALNELLEDVERGSTMCAAIKLDLDDFTDINDTYGIAAGDEVIQAYAFRLSKIDARMLARTGGDEFTLVFDHPLTASSVELKQITDLCHKPVIWGDALLDVGASIGVVADIPPERQHELMRRTDLAIAHAKEASGKQTLRFYEDRMNDEFVRNAAITFALRNALDNGGLFMLYQPQVDILTHEVYGYEALARLSDGSYGPQEFITIAEKSGLIIELGRQVTKLVVVQQARWMQEGRPSRVVSLNYSAGQLEDADYCDYLRELLEEYKVPASLIKVEVTESMMLEDNEHARALIEKLKEMGVKIALDDFGTGYSSLERLTYDSIDFVKLDRSIILSFLVPGRDSVIRNVAHMTHDLNKRLVMEGVETKEQLESCERLGCDFIQGYYFSRPLPADEVYDWHPAG